MSVTAVRRRTLFAWLSRLGVLVATLLCLSPRYAAAQGALQVSSTLSPPIVEVGQPFQVELQAMADQAGSTPSDPKLSAPPGISVSSVSQSTRTQAQLSGGVAQVRVGLGANWTLFAASPGKYIIPAPSVLWNGTRHRGQNMQVEVVPVGQGPSSSGGGRIPSMPAWPFGQLDDADEPEEDFDGDQLTMDEPLDRNVFLRAVADKHEAVVGEQVTVSFYLYYRVDFELKERHEAAMKDFVRFPMIQNPGLQGPKITRVGGQRWDVRLIDRVAIFPVRAGKLEVGEMTGRFTGRRIGADVLRTSNNEVITVTEPPADGRPTGYRVGDVGNFTLTASVSPRKLDQGSSLGVTLRVEGSGNLPSVLNVPARTGIEWLDPEKKQDINAVDGVVTGWRTFGYVVRVKESGDVDLGEVDLSFWDPKKNAYQVVTAKLGVVEVTPGTPSDAEIEDAMRSDARDPFAAMPAFHPTMEAFSRPSPPLLEGEKFWAALVFPPFLVGLGLVFRRAVRGARRRRALTQDSAATKVQEALRDARAAKKSGDVAAVAAAAERAIHSGIEAATGLRSRGVLREDLVSALVDRELPEELATKCKSLLDQCEQVRFDPDAEEVAGDLTKQARLLVADLAQAGKNSA